MKNKVIKKLMLSFALLPCLANAQGFINKTDVLIGSDMTYYPYEYIKDGKQAGFDIEYMTQLSKYMNRKPDFKDTRFSNLIVGLRGGKYDIMASSLYITSGRLKAIDMVPYLKGGQSIVMLNSDAKPLTEFKSLCGKNVATMQGSFAARRMLKANDSLCKGSPIKVLGYPSTPEATRALFNHAADAELTDAAQAKGLIDRLGGKLRITSTDLLSPVLLGIGVRKNDTEVRDALKSAMKKFEATPEYEKLLAKYGFKRLTEDDVKSLMPTS